MGLFSRKKEHPMHKQLEDYQKKKREKEIQATYEKAYHKARLAEAKGRGRREGLKGKPSMLKTASRAMDDMQELIGGKGFTFGPAPQSKRKKKKDDLWDLI